MIPWWARVMFWGLRAQRRALDRGDIIAEELLRGFLAPQKRSQVTFDVYAGMADAYAPGGALYESGLWAWEREIVESDVFPRRGRILLGAAGGGRELAALAARGYEVVAFEPCDLVEGAREAVAHHASCTVIRASYEDLVRAVERGDGPLAAVTSSAPFDAVILGWASLSHVLAEADQIALLRAARKVAPKGPLVASFRTRGVGRERLRRAMRRGIERVVAPDDPALIFRVSYGVVHAFTRDELEDLAVASGYSLTRYNALEEHAVFVPTR